jgi:3',5'-cyclic-AMP phosphodiesterase
MPCLKLAIVADIHCGQDTDTKKGTAALELLGTFLRAAEAAGADALIDLGDRISDLGSKEDFELANRVGAACAAITIVPFCRAKTMLRH